MIRALPAYIIQFILLVLIQVLVLNNIQFSGYINPYLYILFILLLPFETPRWVLMIIGFFLGLSIDIFTHTPGMHASATVFAAFIRPMVLSSIAPRDGYESGMRPHIPDMGLGWYMRYAVLMVISHHLFLFYIETFRLSDFFATLLRVILSSVFTLAFILITEIIFYRKKK